MDLKTGADAFTAGGLADILNGGGNLEWPVKLLLGAQRVVRNWVVAGAGQAGAEHHTGWEDIEFDASLIAVHLRRQGCGARRQSHERNIAGSRRRRPRVSVDRICVLQGDGQNDSRMESIISTLCRTCPVHCCIGKAAIASRRL